MSVFECGIELALKTLIFSLGLSKDELKIHPHTNSNPKELISVFNVRFERKGRDKMWMILKDRLRISI